MPFALAPTYDRVREGSGWRKVPARSRRHGEAGPCRAVFMANWKDVAPSVGATQDVLINLNRQLEPLKTGAANSVEMVVVVAPPFTSLQSATDLLSRAVYRSILLGAQDVHYQVSPVGERFTGDIPASALRDLRVSLCVVGHSERRKHHGETDQIVWRKADALLGVGVSPVVCIGESFLPERPANPSATDVDRAVRFVGEQLVNSLLVGRGPAQIAQSLVAYEPVWAIGTGLSARPDFAEAVCHGIREAVQVSCGDAVAAKIAVLYGGSVKADNIASFMVQNNIDGALVGGASLIPAQFAEIIKRGSGG